MAKKNKHLHIFIILLATGVAVYCMVNVAVRFNLFDDGGCIALVHDKAAMRAADKIVLRVGDSRYEITDANFADQITEELMVATHTCLRYAEIDRWIEIYSGDTLVRRMLWASCADETGVFVYENDWLHPIYHTYPSNGSATGMIFPSKTLVEKLNAIIAAADNPAK